jgi:CheY-like chemotaxis protein
VIIVEDNPGDAFIMEEALREHSVDCAVTILSTGEEAEIFVAELERDLTTSCPDVVLLDLNLPKRSGHSVLARIRASSRCASIPVVIVSSSEAATDLAENRRLGATAYFRKSTRLDEFMKLGSLVKSLLRRS